MKSFFLLPLLAGVLSAQALFRCRFGVQTRREWRKLEDPAKKKYIDALRTVMKRPSASKPSFFDTLVKEHMDYGSNVHGYSPFFPWHRYMLAKLEQELQKSGSITLPYWNWGFDSQAPEKAPFWGSGPLQFGGNGNSKNGCVTDGAFAGHTTLYPDKHCLSRDWTRRTAIGAFITEKDLQSILVNSRKYSTYRIGIENPHGMVHVGIGGDMGDPTTSPNDPVFYLHHTNVDRLWWKWQAAYPQLARTYDGSAFNAQSGSVKAASTNRLTPYNAKVSDVFSTENLCYKYIEENLSTTKPKLPPPNLRMSAPTATPTKGTETLPTKVTAPPPTEEEEEGYGTAPVKRPPREVEDNGAKPTAPKGEKPILVGAAPPIRLPEFVKTAPAPETQTPDSTDRADLTKIRTPIVLPDKWIKANNLDADKVRADEKKLVETIKSDNAKSEVVDGALWTRPGVLAKLVEGGAEKFHADVGGLRVEVKPPDEKQSLQAVSDMQELVKQTVKAEGKEGDIKLAQVNKDL